MNPGQCLCGAASWDLVGQPFQAFNCHCKLCRKAHGTAFGTYWFVEPDQIRWRGDTESVVGYRSSEILTRTFCGICGSVTPYSGDTHGTFVAPGGCHDRGRISDCNIFIPHGAPWFEVTGDLPRHRDYPVETGYVSIEEEPLEEAPEGVVRGLCMCRAIEFHVTGPFEDAYNCHCSRCRRARAAAHASNGRVPLSSMRYVRGEEHLKSYHLPGSRCFTQVFCEICGSKMPRIDKEGRFAVVPLGILEEDPGIRPRAHFYQAFMAQWHEITDDLPVFPGAPESSGGGPRR